MIKAITFDLDGVYFLETGKKGFHKRLVELCGDEDKVIHALYRSDEMRDLVRGKLTEDVFISWLNRYLGTKFSVGEFADFWVADYEINPQVQSLIKEIRSNGMLSCTCSNNNPIRVNALESKFHFLDDFDAKVFSYEVCAFKPSKEIFQSLIDKAGVNPQEIVYSDDNPDRLQGAAELGIITFVYTNFEEFKNELVKLGVNL